VSAASPSGPALASVLVPSRPDATTAVANLIRFLETGVVPEGLFAPDVFADLSLPRWRVQTTTRDAIVAERLAGHASGGQVRVERVEPTAQGFTIEFEEWWQHDGQRWYAREMIRADVVGATIVEMAIYCTGDWDEARQREHAAAAGLVRG
jgi:hypothetical protein